MKAAELIVQCLAGEGVKHIFGLPGEEVMDLLDALSDSAIQFVTVRHEQSAAFMADVYGRLTSRAGVCLSTLGPGATNLVTGVADANLDRAPLVALAGQTSTDRMHKESHQYVDLVSLFRPITKWTTSLRSGLIIPEALRKAFKLAQAEKPGATFIEIPENIAAGAADEVPLRVQSPHAGPASVAQLERAARAISQSARPVVLAGNGVTRGRASDALVRFAQRLNIPVATTFMGKGVIPDDHPLWLGTIGLKTPDLVNCGFDRADVVIAVGYDFVEYPPSAWNPDRDKIIVHVDMSPAEVDAAYVVEVGVLGNISESLDELANRTSPCESCDASTLRQLLHDELDRYRDDRSFPLKPQRIVADLRAALGVDDIVISDVGAHKLWLARLYPCYRPNTCVISNGVAAMGLAVPGAIAAKLVHPQQNVVAVAGDGGFLMTSHELETAIRIQANIVVLVLTDQTFGLIEWKQLNEFGRPSFTAFRNPNLVQYAESFGARGFRVEAADELRPALAAALAANTVAVIDCPVDFAENLRLTEKLGQLECPS